MPNKNARSTGAALGNKFAASYDVQGAQAADVFIELTDNRALTVTGANTTNSGRVISTQFREFCIQTTPANGRNVTIQLNAGGGWVDAPASLLSAVSATLAPGALVFMSVPMPGIAVRLKVAQPLAATDFTIKVMMYHSTTRRDVGRA